MRGGLPLLGIVCLLAVAPLTASAGTVYRCDTDQGRSYVSKRIAGAECAPVSRYTASDHTSSAPSRTLPDAAAAVTSGDSVAADSGDGAGKGGQVLTRAVAVSSKRPTRRVHGQVYSFIKDGVRHYSSERPRSVASISAVRTIKYSFLETCYACAAQPGVNFSNVPLNLTAFDAEVRAAAAEFGVDEAIVRAIIHAESAFNPNALSRVGAQGLMQLMPATAKRFGVGNPFDAAQNIRGGVEYLAWLLDRFDGNLTLAAAGYNAGEGNVDKYDGVPPFSETQRYVQRVGVLAERYRAAQ